MKKWIGLLVVLIGVGGWWWSRGDTRELVSPKGEVVPEPEYAKYAFERLVARKDQGSEIVIEGEVFGYRSEGKRVTGAIHIPEGEGPFPLIVMLRGYADKEVYYTGYGTNPAAEYFAAQGYLTMAPDFLGYGGSETEDEDILGARVKRPVEVLDLLASLRNLELVDLGRVYLWGHSNGGQIGLSVLEVLGKRGDEIVRAASLWAPVSKPFPYSILYYTDEADDRGKYLRGEIARWEAEYDVFEYSIDRYWDWLGTPLQIHQGTADEAVPVEWSRELVEALEVVGKETRYYEYPGADHNMKPLWGTVVARDVEWFGAN